MFIKHNFLRWYRKRAQLTQKDLVFILGAKDKSMVSRWEQGDRKPDIYTLLAYHLLFDIPIEMMFSRQRAKLLENIRERIALRIQYLKANRPDGHAVRRIQFLHEALTKLSPPVDTV